MSMLRRILTSAPSGCKALQAASISASAPMTKLVSKLDSTNVETVGAWFYVPPSQRKVPYWDYHDRENKDSTLPDTWPAKASEWQKCSMVKDGETPRGPQADYPELKYHLPYDTSKYRCWIIPEAYFNFLHERTGVLGPYILLWGGVATMLSKEYFIFNGESAAFFAYLIMPLYFAHRFGGGIDKHLRTGYNESMSVIEKMKRCKSQEFTNEADALEEDKTRNEAGKELFEVYATNADNAIEAEFRSRQEQVYQAFKRRADYQLALQSLEENLVQKQLVAWVKDEVTKAIHAKGEKDTVRQCIADLKSLAARSQAAI